MARDQAAAAAERLEAALTGAALEDPRPYFRAHLRALRERDQAAFERAVRTYEEELLPRAADPRRDVLTEWLDYGLRLAALTGPGRTVLLDATGRASDSPEPPPLDRMAVFIPDDAGSPVLPLIVPASTSPAQQAALDLLVHGRTG